VAEEPAEQEPVAEEPVEQELVAEEPVAEELYEEVIEEEMPVVKEESLPEEIVEDEMPETEPDSEIAEEVVEESEIMPLTVATAIVESYEEPVEEEPVEEYYEEPVAEEPQEEEPVEEVLPEPEYFEEEAVEEAYSEPQEEYEATYEGYYQEPSDEYYQYEDPTVVEEPVAEEAAYEVPVAEEIIKEQKSEKKKYKLPKPPKKDKVNFFWFLIALLWPPYPGIMLWITKSAEQPKASRVYGAEAILMYILKHAIKKVAVCALLILAIAGALVGAFFYIQGALAQAGYMLVLPWMM
jgi:hypothetical protein